MALVKPIAQSVPAFDANNDNIFTFVSEGGNQVIANRLVIRENDTNEIKYDNRIESYRFEHKLPSQTLKNGIYYNFYFITYDVNGNESEKSNTIIFKCYTTPTLKITNIPESKIINGTTFDLNIEYNQEQHELLDSAKVILYNALGNEIYQSEKLYNRDVPYPLPINIKYKLFGLENDNTYFISVTAITVNKTIINSEKYTITSRYGTPQMNSLVELKNICEEGYVQIKNNFYVIDSESNPEDLGTNPKYIYDSKINLLEDKTFLKYNKGFNIQNDFIIRLLMETPKLGRILTMSNNLKEIQINLIEDYPYLSNTKRYCLELKSYNNCNIPYIIYSDYIDNLNKIFVAIKREKNLFKIILKEMI